MHPYVIDTSIIFNLTGHRKWKSKLSVLTDVFCKRKIQTAVDGHNPIEDAKAAMELVLLKLKQGINFGDVIGSGNRNLSSSTKEMDLTALSREVLSYFC